jgi:hypothetical protein
MSLVCRAVFSVSDLACEPLFVCLPSNLIFPGALADSIHHHEVGSGPFQDGFGCVPDQGRPA